MIVPASASHAAVAAPVWRGMYPVFVFTGIRRIPRVAVALFPRMISMSSVLYWTGTMKPPAPPVPSPIAFSMIDFSKGKRPHERS